MDHVEDVYRYSGHFADDPGPIGINSGDVYRVCDSRNGGSGVCIAVVGAVGFGVVYVCGGGAVVSACALYEPFHSAT